ncbi:NudC domain containing protein 3 [Echinococcus multilocularis]|uniref:NudC domain containing protein 3 n=1 Tax=Echinococcus multilocularis TaxID=6211 RepID=A0A068Y5P5_ECHMU|nr:NudC domain containing protein 3 [Echinococcus multilocularis]
MIFHYICQGLQPLAQYFTVVTGSKCHRVMDPRYDSALIGILQNEGSLEKYLEVMFGFLMRRTDFFYEHKPGKNLGFPPGHALKMVLKAFDKYDTIFRRYQEEQTKQESSVQEAAAKEPTSSLENTERQTISLDSRPTSKADLNDKTSKSEVKTEKSSSGSYFKKDENGERIYEADPDCYNGARRDLYSWSQKILEIDIHVKIPERIKTARQLNVKINRKHILIAEKGSTEPILDLDLLKEIKTESAQWSFEVDEHLLTLSLDKVDEYWWEAAFVGEEKINVQEIDCSRPIHELDEEAQGKIAQLIFDQEQKRRGLPTTEEQRIQDILKDAWNKDGSPFKGQPFDPSSISVESSSQLPTKKP